MSYSFKEIFHRLILSFWFSKREKGLIYLAILCLFNILVVTVLIKINYWYADFYTALQNKNTAEFFKQLSLYGGLLSLLVFSTVLASYSERRLSVQWREWFSKTFIHQWFDKNQFYYLSLTPSSLDNPDQRISQDINLFCKNSIQFFVRFLNEGLQLCSFVTILWTLSGPLDLFEGGVKIHGWLVWIGLFYAMLGTWITLVIGKPLVTLEKTQEQKEADFRYALVQARDHASPIVENQASQWEKENLFDKFEKIVGNYHHLIVQKLRLDLWSEGFKYSTYILPFLLICPLYFSGKIDFGQLMQLKAAYASVQYSLSLIIHQYHHIAEWKANGQRLLQFQNTMETDTLYLKKATIVLQSSDFKVKNLVLLKENHALCQPFDFHIKPAEKILLHGDNGSGKSLFFKGILGLWPEASGTLYHPSSLLSLSQTPYLGASLWKDFSPEEITFCKEIFQQLSLSSFSLKTAGDHYRFCLSQQIVQACRYKNCYLILDNPLGFFDPTRQKILLDLLAQWLPKTALLWLETNCSFAGEKSFFNRISPLKDIFNLSTDQ